MYGMLLFVIIAIFVAGLMVGRTPEYLGKKLEAKEVKMALLAILILPLSMLGFTAAAAVPSAVASTNNAGPHGFTEILYAYVSHSIHVVQNVARFCCEFPSSTSWSWIVR